MNELRDKIFSLVNKLDSDERIIRVKNINEKIKLDSDFCLVVERYKKYNGIDDELFIKSNPLYLEYLDSERQVNLLIGNINNKLSNINCKKNCNKCGGCSESN